MYSNVTTYHKPIESHHEKAEKADQEAKKACSEEMRSVLHHHGVRIDSCDR